MKSVSLKNQLDLFPQAIPVSEFKELHGIDLDEAQKRLKNLERKVFIWGDTRKEDLEYFHQGIKSWLVNDRYYDGEWLSPRDLAWRLNWYANNRGKTIKYLYFNERRQKLYIDRDFWKWFILKIDLISWNLLKYEAVP